MLALVRILVLLGTNFSSKNLRVSALAEHLSCTATARLLRIEEVQAGVAQLVEHHVANVIVVGSSPITRSKVCKAHFVPRLLECDE